jgi:hypothetical protein
MKKRKIGFYYLKLQSDDGAEQVISLLNHLLANFSTLGRVEKRHDLKLNKFCFVESFVLNGGAYKILMKSAVYKYRPNFVRRGSVEERENQKLEDEGEVELTHFVAKIVGNDVVLAGEQNHIGVNTLQFIEYLNSFLERIPEFENDKLLFEIIARENFLDQLNELSRVTCAELIVDKQVLGSAALNYSPRFEQASHEIKITVKAVRAGTIVNVVRDAFNLISGNSTTINKMRVIGRNSQNHEVIFNTDFIEKRQLLELEVNEQTGEISTHDIFTQMSNILL